MSRTIPTSVGYSSLDAKGLFPRASFSAAAISTPLNATTDIVFSSTDNDTAAWTSGTLTFSNGKTSGTISAGSTGNITATTYVYYDVETLGELQITTTASVATGLSKLLVAIVEAGAAGKDCKITPFAGAGLTVTGLTADSITAGTITATEIAAGAITTTEIAANTITAGNIAAGTITTTELTVSQLSAITADMGTITAGAMSGITIAIGTGNSIFKADANGTYLGNATFASAPFRVSMAGAVTASSLTLTNASIGAGSAYTGNQIAEAYIGNLNASKITAGTINADRIGAGTITGAKIAGTTITAGNIAANTITGSEISGTTLSGIFADIGTITSGSITGVTITGGTVRTAVSGARIQLDSNYMRIYNPGGTLIGSIAPSGGVILTGGSWINTGNVEFQSAVIMTGDFQGGFKVTGNIDMDSNSLNNTNQVRGSSGNIDFNETGRIQISTHFDPPDGGSKNMGGPSRYWGDISYKTLTDRGCLGWFDDGVELQDGTIVSDLEAINAVKKHKSKKTVYGVPMLDYKTLPKVVYKKAADHDGNELPVDKKGRPYEINKAGKKLYAEDGAETTALISIMFGAIKELSEEVTMLKSNNVKNRNQP